MMDFGITGVAAITVLCFLVAEGAKSFGMDTKRVPVLCGLVGCILGVIGYHVMNGFPAQDWLTAMAVGAVSGLASTGAHQIYKQARK